ncbi:MAG: hypothetical protein DYG92_09610 [Leptolyngbya sp. PLA1]|nr:hypothetical protein [Leptolyngbya sp. PLA1]
MLALAAGTLAGCAGPAAQPGHAPADFSVSVEVRQDATGLDPVWLIVMPGGEMFGARGDRTAKSPSPPLIRTLSRREVDEVWTLTDATGVWASAPVPGVSDAPSREGDTGGVIVSASGARVRRTVRFQPVTPEALALTRRLRALAWAD